MRPVQRSVAVPEPGGQCFLLQLAGAKRKHGADRIFGGKTERGLVGREKQSGEDIDGKSDRGIEPNGSARMSATTSSEQKATGL